MLITYNISLDLATPGPIPQVFAVQGENGTRQIALTLLYNGEPWTLPEGTFVSIRYRKPDVTGGSYDTLPHGETAWHWADGILMLQLAPQMLTVPGCVVAQVSMVNGDALLATFSFQILVEPDPSAGVSLSDDYVNWTNWTNAQLEQMLSEAKASGDFDGVTPQLQIGTVTTLPAGSEASASIRGSTAYPLLDLNLPQGGMPPLDATLTQADAAAPAAEVGLQLAQKAPAGFGLGGGGAYKAIASLSDLDNLSANGTYKIASTAGPLSAGSNDAGLGGLPFNVAVLVCESGDDNFKWQRLRAFGYPTWYLERSYNADSGWGKWAHVNPPMAPGVEYRTRERYNSKAVYAKLIRHTMAADTGSPTSTTPVTISTGIQNASDLVDLKVVYERSDGSKSIFPAMSDEGNNYFGTHKVASNTFDLSIVLNNAMVRAGNVFNVLIKYTKTTN